MSNVLTTVDEWVQRCRSRARARTIFYNLLFFLSAAFFPLLEAFYFNYTMPPEKVAWVISNTPLSGFGVEVMSCVYIWLLGILHFFAILLVVFTGKEDIVEQTFSLVECEKQLARLHEVREFAHITLESMLNFMWLCGGISSKMMLLMRGPGPVSGVKTQEVMDLLLADNVDNLKEIFGFNAPKSHFNFAIYCRVPNSDTLKCVYTLRDEYFAKIKGDNESRSWELGQGHVGKCFAHDVSELINDLTEHPDFVRTEREGDSDFYRSVMSVPLRRAVSVSPEGEDEPFTFSQDKFGVMVMTSSIPDQFKGHHLEMLKYLRKKLEEFIYELSSKENK